MCHAMKTNIVEDMSADRLPVVIQLAAGGSAEQAFARLATKPHCLFLDSSLRHPERGRYSYVTADPFKVLHVPAGTDRGLQSLRQSLGDFRIPFRGDLPPFQGGAAGVLTYEFGQALERLPVSLHDEFALPWVTMGLYDVVLAFDHQAQTASLISQGFPEREPASRRERAAARAAEFLRWLDEPVCLPKPISFNAGNACGISSRLVPCGRRPGVMSNFTASEYQAAVQQAIEYIRAGDIFQVNLSQRLLQPSSDHAVRLYLRMRTRTPATFAGYFDAGDWQVISASPERFVLVERDEVEARPIKGTRRRTRQPEADLFAGDELLASDKDRSENVMIVDLLRNDLSRVCKPASVHVPQLCGLESFGYVQHLVSAVRGQLAEGTDCLDVLAASYPGGSITGAPKPRAMEIITELEQVARGAYCGSLGYISWNGCMDMNILIRTLTASRGWWQFPVGGGIVAGSSPAAEYEETWHKATGVLAALQ